MTSRPTLKSICFVGNTHLALSLLFQEVHGHSRLRDMCLWKPDYYFFFSGFVFFGFNSFLVRFDSEPWNNASDSEQYGIVSRR